MIGADSSATFGDGAHIRTIEQLTERKIEIIGEQVIVAGTGYLGHGQRFCEVVQKMHKEGGFKNKPALAIARQLSKAGISDFSQTVPTPHLKQLDYSAFVAYPAGAHPCLCELPGLLGFQPEIKEPGDLWFTSAGSGQHITDSFLALFKEIFWKDGPPNVRGGIFTALWALRHACEVNPGGIKGPVRIAVLAREGSKLRAQMLDDDKLAEHQNIVTAATEHMRGFLEILDGKTETSDVPQPPKH